MPAAFLIALFASPLMPALAAKEDGAKSFKATSAHLLEQAHAKLLSGDMYAAGEIGNKAGWFAAGDAEVHAHIGYLFLMVSNADGVLEKAQLAVALQSPVPPERILLLASAWFGVGNRERGQAALQKAAQASSRYAPLLELSRTASEEDRDFAIKTALSEVYFPAYVEVLDKKKAAASATKPKPPEAPPPAAEPPPRRFPRALAIAGASVVVGALFWLLLRRAARPT